MSFLVVLPVFGEGKALPEGYAVTLASPERPQQPVPGKTIRHKDNPKVYKTPVKREGEEKTGTAKAPEVSSEVTSEVTKSRQTAAVTRSAEDNPVSDKAEPVAETLETETTWESSPAAASEAKQLLAAVPFGPVQVIGSDTDMSYKSEKKDPAETGISEAVEDLTSPAPPPPETKAVSSRDGIDLSGNIGKSDDDNSGSGRKAASMKEMSAGQKSKKMQKMPAVSIHVPDALLEKDIEIEVVAQKMALSDIAPALAVRAHPGNGMRRREGAVMKVDGMQLKTADGNTGATARKTLILLRAAKGVYIFSLKNNGKTSFVDVAFHIHAGSENERIKEYNSVSLKPAGVIQFKFLMPEALFWDDDDLFSGTVEDGNSVMKFISDTGLIWKEDKK